MKPYEFYRKLEQAGHVLKKDDDGEVDNFAYDYGFHNGPVCELCGEMWCEHCHEEGSEIEPCSSPAIDSHCHEIIETNLIDRGAK